MPITNGSTKLSDYKANLFASFSVQYTNGHASWMRRGKWRFAS